MSFLDHDRPDYSVDGTIVLANGLTAKAADGQESDVFPAYWSPALRQFINYDGHNGYDFAISYQPVYAAAAGTVQFADWSNSGYGNMILINHHNGYVTLYGHLSQIEVHAGEQVTTGQEIAISGSTGNSTGPHLHFSVFHDCNVADPYGWTGSGRDPLQSFSGSPSSYLWLPGHDPLLVNPPPNWPSFPAGLSVRIPPQDIGIAAQEGSLPPADRLLLLALPAPGQSGPVDPGMALAATEALMSEEAEHLAPQLDDLRAQGLIDSYQLIPAAGAIWIHGSATAQELESLTGVASLSGAEPRDLLAAEQGLSHAVLINMGRQAAPALWPSGFRSGLHTWRPVTTILLGSALVAGFGLPGENATVALHRGDTVVATATTSADPDSGGFVTMLHDALGSSVNVRPGDIIEVSAGGRTSRVQAEPLSVQARRMLIFGNAARATSLSISMLPPNGRSSRVVIGAGLTGRYLETPSRPMPAGSLVVAETADDAGNYEAASAFVPGFVAVEGTGQVSGWTVGQAPRLRVTRAGRVVAERALKSTAHGTFQVELEEHGTPVILKAGDVITLGSARHHRSVTLPVLAAPLSHLADLRIEGPPGGTVQLSFQPAGRRGWTRKETLGASGFVRVPLGGPAAPGDSSLVRLMLPSGDAVESIDEARGILVHEGSGHVDGKVRPGAVISLSAWSMGGKELGSSVASTGLSGEFHSVLRDSHHHPLRFTSVRTLVVREDRTAITFRLPAISVRLDVSRSDIVVTGPRRSRLFLTQWSVDGARHSIHLDTNDIGRTREAVSPGNPRRLAVAWTGPNGLTIERVIVIHSAGLPGAKAIPAPACDTSRSHHARVLAHGACNASRLDDRFK